MGLNPFVSHDSLTSSALEWKFKFLTSKHIGTSMWHSRPSAHTFQRPAYSLIGQ